MYKIYLIKLRHNKKENLSKKIVQKNKKIKKTKKIIHNKVAHKK